MCDSMSTYNIIRRHYSIGKDLCNTVPVGVDQHRFFNIGSTRISNSLFFLGRLDSRKGIDFLIKAIPYVKKRLQNVQLFIGGEGILKPHLKTFVKNNQLENNVRFLGTIEDEKLNEWYNKVKVVVIPSVFEGFGLTAIEAMACGTPVIATDADALRDVVNNGVNGLLVHYNDVKGLQNSILDVLTNKNKWSLLSNNGKKIIKTDYNWTDIADQVLRIYKHASERNIGDI